MGEILPEGRVGRFRTYGLGFLEFLLFLGTCLAIVVAWERFDGPPASFGLLVAGSLFAANFLVGVYSRAVYVSHTRRLMRSALAHLLALLALLVFCVVASLGESAMYFVLGMVFLRCMVYGLFMLV